MKIVFFGTGSFGIPSLKVIINELSDQAQLLSVVTSPDAAKGRGLEPSPSPVKTWALTNRVPVLPYESSPSFFEGLKKLQADLFIVIDFGYLLPKQLLELPKKMCVNLHASLLPRHRGPAPIQWALIDGDSKTGVSIIRMVEKLDAGDLLAQETLGISRDDDLNTLSEKLSSLGASLLLKTIVHLNVGKIESRPQDESQVTYARKIKKEDGHIDWRLTSDEIRNRFRAFKPWPTSYCFFKNRRLIVRELQSMDPEVLAKLRSKFPKELKPGTVLWTLDYSEGVVVSTGHSAVRILSIQTEGKKSLPIAEFLKGFPLKEGDVLE